MRVLVVAVCGLLVMGGSMVWAADSSDDLIPAKKLSLNVGSAGQETLGAYSEGEGKCGEVCEAPCGVCQGDLCGYGMPCMYDPFVCGYTGRMYACYANWDRMFRERIGCLLRSDVSFYNGAVSNPLVYGMLTSRKHTTGLDNYNVGNFDDPSFLSTGNYEVGMTIKPWCAPRLTIQFTGRIEWSNTKETNSITDPVLGTTSYSTSYFGMGTETTGGLWYKYSLCAPFYLEGGTRLRYYLDVTKGESPWAKYFQEAWLTLGTENLPVDLWAKVMPVWTYDAANFTHTDLTLKEEKFKEGGVLFPIGWKKEWCLPYGQCNTLLPDAFFVNNENVLTSGIFGKDAGWAYSTIGCGFKFNMPNGQVVNIAIGEQFTNSDYSMDGHSNYTTGNLGGDMPLGRGGRANEMNGMGGVDDQGAGAGAATAGAGEFGAKK